MEDKTVVEINGVKLEIDLRSAKRIDTFRIGDNVKVLIPGYSGEQKVFPGVIVGFENFRDLPTIIVAYLEIGYTSSLHFMSYNSRSEGRDLVHCCDDYLPIEKDTVVRHMDREIASKEHELEGLKSKKEYFLKHFNRYFSTKE